MKLLYALSLCGTAFIFGCDAGRPAAPPSSTLIHEMIGQQCKVQFRRDYLGAASPIPISPTTDNINGMDLVLSGTLKKAQSDSILISRMQSDILIPMNAILYLSFDEPAKPASK